MFRFIFIAAVAISCASSTGDQWYCYDNAGAAKAAREGRGTGPFRNNANAGTHLCTPAELDIAKISNDVRPANQKSK